MAGSEFFLQGNISSEILLPLQQEILTAHDEWHVNVPFTLYISSQGGGVEEGLSMVSLIHAVRRSGRIFNTHIAGGAYSMGAIISQAGSHRSIDSYGFLMLHEQSMGVENDSLKKGDFKHHAAQLEATEKVLVDIVASRSGMDAETVRGRFFEGPDVYIGAVVALELGLVDEVLEDL